MWVGVRALVASSSSSSSSFFIWGSILFPFLIPATATRRRSFQFHNLTQRSFLSLSLSLTTSTTTTTTTAAAASAQLQGVIEEDQFIGYLVGKKKATDLAHSVWKNVVRKGDTVVDATCGNGHDTLALLKLVAPPQPHVDGESGLGTPNTGCVYGFDIQNQALHNTSLLLQQSLPPNHQRKLVKLFPMCHSNMEQVIPKGAPVRLVAFNLGYLPGGDKETTTMSRTTLLALEAAGRIIDPGGLISIVVYVGHSMGRKEFEAVQAFASGLSTENWMCSQLQLLNRPMAPVPIFIFKR